MCTVQRCTLEILSAGAFSDVGVFYSALGWPRLMGQLSALCSLAHKAFDSPLKDTHTHTLDRTHMHINMYAMQSAVQVRTPLYTVSFFLPLTFHLAKLKPPPQPLHKLALGWRENPSCI